jgi:3-oxoacyl-[acyl-carrier protein] reductase
VDLGLAGKTFLVGGGSKGLGRAIAGELVAEGASVLLVSRDPGALETAAAELGERASTCAADLGTPEGVDAAVAAARALGGLDGILVNAGGPPPGDALDVPDEQWAQAFQLLVGSPVRMLRALLPDLRDGASILFVTSSSVRVPIPGLDTSNVIRPGVAALVKCLAVELGPRIRVNSLAPGRIDTERVRFLDATRAEASGSTVADQRAAMERTIPLGRYGEPAEIGRVAAFLLSPAASYVSGAAIQVDGAYVRAVP